MEIVIFLFILGSIGLVIWGLISSQPSTLLRMPQEGPTVKFQKPKFDFARIFPTESFLQKTGMAASIKKNLDNAHIGLSAGAFFNLKILLCVLLAVLAAAASEKFDPLILIIAIAMGYIIPDFYLKR
ncbi:MAG: hypothetical protein Q7S42_01980, partial [Candidatus Omnitrophota bacterium]|nr:hypothetical protein [Candidatus Omnitrophota bacterium]